MKKGIIIILLVLLIPTISAAEISIRDFYSPKETLLAEIKGNFVSLDKSEIFIYESGIPRPEPVKSDLTKQNGRYYYYAVLPNKEGEFSIRLKDVQVIESGSVTTKTITQNFIINKTNTSALSIEPGFIVTSKDFTLKITSLNEDLETYATIAVSNQSTDISLTKDIEETFTFPISDITSDTYLEIEGYSVPIFVIGISTNQSNTTTYYNKPDIKFTPEEITATVVAGGNYFFQILLENTGELDLDNLVLSNNLNARLSPDTINFLKTNDNITLNLSISIPNDAEDNLSGLIIVDSEDIYRSLPVIFYITKNKTQINLNGTSVIEDLSCIKIGNLCDDDEICNGETTRSLEGPCCIGECVKEGKDKSTSWIFGVALIVFMVVFVYLIYKRLRERKKIKSPEQMLKDKQEKYKKRMQNKPEEVSGKLDRI